MYVTDFLDEYRRWRKAAERAIAQVPDDQFNRVLFKDGNSIAMLMRHVGGNLASRFGEFLTADGEKPSRDRDGEFGEGPFTRADAQAVWDTGWNTLDENVSPLPDDALDKMVAIRGVPLSVHSALTRSLAHIANHCGQIILLARILATGEWEWITIPKGKSREYNANPIHEKAPR